jgi:hypothetical protein
MMAFDAGSPQARKLLAFLQSCAAPGWKSRE